ncbi:MAG: hypothetical protein PHD81_03175 [Candidatus Nanoarchaeia archaeon]|nr:hypothetical protein [Candidatus Nanoarchaeia archaeon]MDD5588086.1 hypothetical protein [Candidatus Nanoarchaeia archaeon]
MSIDTLTTLHYGDIIKFNAGLTQVVGHFIKKEGSMIYVQDVIPNDRVSHEHISIPNPKGYLYANLKIKVLEKYNK